MGGSKVSRSAALTFILFNRFNFNQTGDETLGNALQSNPVEEQFGRSTQILARLIRGLNPVYQIGSATASRPIH